MNNSPGIFTEEFKDEVFWIWTRHCKQSARRTYRHLKDKKIYSRIPSAKTIARWALDNDWEANSNYISNESRAMVKELDKQYLSFIGQDAAEAVFLDWMMREKVVKALKRRGRRALEPTSINEVVTMIKLIHQRGDELMERANRGAENANEAPPEARRVVDMLRNESLPEGMRDSRALYREVMSQKGLEASMNEMIEAEVIRPIKAKEESAQTKKSNIDFIFERWNK